MKILTKRIINAAVAAAILTSAFTGCALPADERTTAENAGLSEDAGKTTTAAEVTGATTGSSAEPETDAVTELETEPETDAELWSPLPEKLEKVYSQAKLEDEFRDNEVFFTVFPQYNKKTYTLEDFTDIDCIAIEELMSADENMKNPSRIFLLTLKGHSKANVLEAIKKLEQRADIYCADPHYKEYLIE